MKVICFHVVQSNLLVTKTHCCYFYILLWLLFYRAPVCTLAAFVCARVFVHPAGPAWNTHTPPPHTRRELFDAFGLKRKHEEDDGTTRWRSISTLAVELLILSSRRVRQRSINRPVERRLSWRTHFHGDVFICSVRDRTRDFEITMIRWCV